MKTSNFDLLVEIKEDFIDRALAIAFYTSAIPTIVDGKVALSSKLPAEMKSFGDIKFEIRLKEPPTVDAIEDGAIRVLLYIEFSLDMLKGLRYKFDLVVSVAAVPILQPQANHLVVDLSQGQIDELVINNKEHLPRKTIKAVNEVIKAALKSHLLDQMENIDLTPFLKPLEVPDPVEGIDAAMLWNNGKAYFFKGGMCQSYDVVANKADANGLTPIQPGWLGVWGDGVDAAMVYPNGKAYFFREECYVQYDIATAHVDQPAARIKDGWPGVWGDGIDACVAWNNGKAYLFKGQEYICYDIASGKADDGYPLDIAGHWPGVWADGIDAVVLWNNGKAFFFKGDEYISYDVAADMADPGYPRKITSGWTDLWLGELPLPARPGGFKTIGQRTLAAGVNLFANPLGDIVPVQDYTGSDDLWLGIPDRAMYQIFDFAWINTAQHQKRKHWQDTYDVANMVDDSVKQAARNFVNIGFKLLTGGVLDEHIDVESLRFDASASVYVGKPDFDFKPGNVFEVNSISVHIGLYLKCTVKIKSSTSIDIIPFIDATGVTIDSSESTFVLLDEFVALTESATDIDVQLTTDLQKGMFAKILSLKLSLHLGFGLLDQALTWLTNEVVSLVLQIVPPIRLLPPLLEEKVKVQAVHTEIQKDIITIDINDYVVPQSLTVQIPSYSLIFDDQELTAALSLTIAEMGRTVTPLPLFVANTNPKRLEVHRLNCQWVDKIDQAYRRAYYVLIDAIHDGFDGCKYCLPEYNTR